MANPRFWKDGQPFLGVDAPGVPGEVDQFWKDGQPLLPLEGASVFAALPASAFETVTVTDAVTAALVIVLPASAFETVTAADGVTTFFPGPYESAVRSDGASHLWRLNETVGSTAVDCISGADGTLTGGVTLGVTGPIGTGPAMTFSTGMIETAVPVLVPVTATIEAWIKTTSATQQATFSTRNTGVTGPFVFGLVAAGQLGFFADSPGILAAGATVANDGAWHHAVVVTNGTTVTFYLDAVLDNSLAYARVLATSGGTAAIGSDDSATGDFVGSIDEVAVYPYALTPTQIAHHYLLGIPHASSEDTLSVADDASTVTTDTRLYANVADTISVDEAETAAVLLVSTDYGTPDTSLAGCSILVPPAATYVYSRGLTPTLSIGTAKTHYPVTNLTDGSASTVCRVTGSEGQWDFDLVVARRPDLLACINCNFDPDTFIHVIASDSPDFSSASLNVFFSGHQPNCWIDLRSYAITARYWRLWVPSNSVPLGLGEVIIGTGFTFDGIIESLEYSAKRWIERNLTEYGVTVERDSQSIGRVIRMSLRMDEDSRDVLSQVFEEVGFDGGRVLLIPDSQVNDPWYVEWPNPDDIGFPQSDLDTTRSMDIPEEAAGVL